MKTEKDIIKKFAEGTAKRISDQTITALQEMTEILSGDGSCLENIWEEVCVQVQSEQSFFWDAYDDTVRSLVSAYIEKLPYHEKSALWFQTDDGWDWLYDQDEKSDEKPPVFDHDIVQYIVQKYIYDEAGAWSSNSIDSYLEGGYLD